MRRPHAESCSPRSDLPLTDLSARYQFRGSGARLESSWPKEPRTFQASTACDVAWYIPCRVGGRSRCVRGHESARSERVKRCASCGREIADSATVCDLCEQWAADHIATAPAVSSETAGAALAPLPVANPPQPSSSPLPETTAQQSSASWPLDDATTPVSPPLESAPQTPPSEPRPGATTSSAPRTGGSGLSPRELVIIVAALAVGGVITFALLSARGGASTTVVAANRPAKTKTAPVAGTLPRRDPVVEHGTPCVLDRQSASHRGFRVARGEHGPDLAQLRSPSSRRPLHGQADGSIRVHRIGPED